MISEVQPVSTVANHGTMKNHNLTNFMQILRRHAPISRADISRLTGIDKKCASMFSAELMEAGFIREVGVETSGRGRPGCLLDFVPKRNFSIGVAVQADRINCVLFEFPDKQIRTSVHPLPAGVPLDALLTAIRKVVRDMKRHARKLAGVGVSFPGTMDLREGVIHTATNLPCLNQFHFREPFRALDWGPVWFEQSGRAAALAERWFGGQPVDGNFANIELNIGISVVVANRSGLHHGPEGFVGELGHVIVQPRGRKCRCGNRGCLETYLGESAIKEQLRSLGVRVERVFPPGGAEPTHDDATPPPEVVKVLRHAGMWLGRGMGAIVNLFNPDTIVVQGNLMRYADIVLPRARKELAKCCLAEKFAMTEVSPSRLSFPDAMGSAALCFPGWFEGGFNESLEDAHEPGNGAAARFG